jgi:ribose transport system permease protein
MSASIQTPPAPTTPEGRRAGSAGRRFRLAPVSLPSTVTASLLVLAIVANAALQPTFFTLYSLTSNLATFVPLVFAALAQSFVILGGGLDLSVGAITALSSVTALAVMGGDNARIPLGIVVALLTGAACGLLNGFIVGIIRLQPLIATFGTASVFSGVTLLVLPVPGGAVPSGLTDTYRMAAGPLPVPLLLIVLCALLWAVGRRTVFVRHLFAVGGDRNAAYASLVPVTGTTIASYSAAGGVAGFAALAILANTGSGDPFIGSDIAMNSIAACVLGGLALSGGRGSGYGALAGALILSLISNILFFLGVPTTYRQLASGLIIIAALALSVLSSKGGDTSER